MNMTAIEDASVCVYVREMLVQFSLELLPPKAKCCKNYFTQMLQQKRPKRIRNEKLVKEIVMVLRTRVLVLDTKSLCGWIV